MQIAVRKKNWHEAMRIAATGACSIDAEFEDGQTALLAAAEEDAGALNFEYTQNEDGRAVLAVEFLLDRTSYRPSVNQENKFGQTALMRAAAMGRQHTMQALLDRSADPSQSNRFGQTALHFAAAVGSSECVRMLLERGVDASMRDQNDKTAYDIAYDIGFTKCLTVMSQFGGGFLGDVRESRGNVVDLVRCPMGCGLTMYTYEVPQHSLICDLRQIQCPHSCGIHHMLAKELDDHIAKWCSAFPEPCKDCGVPIKRANMEVHLANQCSHRKGKSIIVKIRHMKLLYTNPIKFLFSFYS